MELGGIIRSDGVSCLLATVGRVRCRNLHRDVGDPSSRADARLDGAHQRDANDDGLEYVHRQGIRCNDVVLCVTDNYGVCGQLGGYRACMDHERGIGNDAHKFGVLGAACCDERTLLYSIIGSADRVVSVNIGPVVRYTYRATSLVVHSYRCGSGAIRVRYDTPDVHFERGNNPRVVDDDPGSPNSEPSVPRYIERQQRVVYRLRIDLGNVAAGDFTVS